ncbi:MAG: 6-carboxytetrahydropterin synthase [Bacteroidota bacterium]
MSSIRLTKEFSFEMAHALFGYDGPCKSVHGHSYKLSVTVKGTPNTNENQSKYGMVIDFNELKSIVKPIIDELDHATMLNANSPHKKLASKNALFDKLVLVNYQPTCENMLIDMADYIQLRLPKNVNLHHLKLQETPTSYAEWYAEDNLKTKK